MAFPRGGGGREPKQCAYDDAIPDDHTLAAHSPLIGFALDGHGIYGLYESYDDDTKMQVKPTDLDACNGHTHLVPANASYGVSGETAVCVISRRDDVSRRE